MAAAGAALSPHGVLAMRVETAIYALVASAATGVADAASAPPEIIRLLAATAGTLVGAFVAAVAWQNIRGSERIWRGLASMGAGLLLAPWASAYVPQPPAISLAEHAFSISGLCAFFAWALVRAAQRRSNAAAEEVVNRAADRAGLPGKRERESGRIRLVLLVLLAGLAFLAWLCRDLIWLVWAMFTTTVH